MRFECPRDSCVTNGYLYVQALVQGGCGALGVPEGEVDGALGQAQDQAVQVDIRLTSG